LLALVATFGMGSRARASGGVQSQASGAAR
jgi:hypothetical protein